jgi:hypothetical protein
MPAWLGSVGTLAAVPESLMVFLQITNPGPTGDQPLAMLSGLERRLSMNMRDHAGTDDDIADDAVVTLSQDDEAIGGGIDDGVADDLACRVAHLDAVVLVGGNRTLPRNLDKIVAHNQAAPGRTDLDALTTGSQGMIGCDDQTFNDMRIYEAWSSSGIAAWPSRVPRRSRDVDDRVGMVICIMATRSVILHRRKHTRQRRSLMS